MLPCHAPTLNNTILQPMRALLLLGTQIHDRLMSKSNLELKTKIYREFGTRAFVDRRLSDTDF